MPDARSRSDAEDALFSGFVPIVRGLNRSVMSWRTVGGAAWGGLLYSGVPTIAVGYAVRSAALRRIGTTCTPILANLNPIVALLTA